MKFIKKIFNILLAIVPFLLLLYVLLIRFNQIPGFSENEPFEMFSDMDLNYRAKPQEINAHLKDSITVLIPDARARAFNKQKYTYSQIEFDEAVSNLKNPLERRDLVLSRGKLKFETFCIYCHGEKGNANGLVITKPKLTKEEEGFPAPPSYLRKETMGLVDERIFHIITVGQNAMFGVGDKLVPEDRWCIVHYVRFLQGK